MDWLISLLIPVGLVAAIYGIIRAGEFAYGDDPAITPRKQWQDVE